MVAMKDKVLIWGGSESFSLNSGASYDIPNNSWVTISSVEQPGIRSAHASVWTGEKLFVVGGYGYSGLLNDGGIFVPE